MSKVRRFGCGISEIRGTALIFPYQCEQGDLDIGEYYKRYAETLLAVDEGIGQIIELLKKKGLYENTLIAVMGDNGFAFGEHGLN